MAFDIFPAIDLHHGRVVRLQLGDPNRQTVFSDDPLEIATRWIESGARWLHVVNLDGAFAESGQVNWTVLDQLGRLPVRIQFGGGLRTAGDVEAALSKGAGRVVLGTAALENPELVSALLQQFGPARIAIGIDARDGFVCIRGWQEKTEAIPLELARSMALSGVRTIIYTDISRDGILSGVNVTATAELAAQTGLDVIASGGVSSLDDVALLRSRANSGIAGVIIGRALYEGQVDLSAAISLAKGG